MEKLKSLDIKRIIKIGTILIGFALIVFISFYSASFDFLNFDWAGWAANSSILVGIMIFGILMGLSVGADIQKEKKGGRFQSACDQYNFILASIDQIKYYFSQFWLWYKERKLIEKKIDYLIDNEYDIRTATIIVKNIEKEDLVIGKLFFDESKQYEKIYIKDNVPIKKLNYDQYEIIKKLFEIKLDTFGESYYLSLFDDGETQTNEAEKGKKIANKIKKDKRNSFIIKIASSLIISIVWSALTVKEFTDGGDASSVQKAWLNLLSRISALITSFVSGYSTSVVNVRDQANAIENKSSILNEFATCYEKKIFVPETYEQMIERELKEQKQYEEEHKVDVEVVDLIPQIE